MGNKPMYLDYTKLPHLIKLFEKAIEIVEVYINQLEAKDAIGNQSLIKDLHHGLSVLNIGKENFTKKEYQEIFFDRPRGKRPGISLSRGFGEFLWHGYDWEVDIMNAVRAIEHYYANM